jgi:signal transduction histidine kinase
MKTSKIYIKIFLSFLLVLVVTEVMIFGLFIHFTGSQFRERLEQYTADKVVLLKEAIGEKMQSSPGPGGGQDEVLRDFLRGFADILDARIWLQDTAGEWVVSSSEQGIPPEARARQAGKAKEFGGFKLYRGKKPHSGFYAVIPLGAKVGRDLSLHVLFEKMPPLHPEGGFALGLVLVGVVIALLVLPVSRLISRPVNRLKDSALRLAGGDLSHRAAVRSKDEIGELGRAFNHMADQVERMIRGGKELTAHVSHELRTPLARIRIAEEMLREDIDRKDFGKVERRLDDIREDIEELDQLIGRILMLSKLDIQEASLRYEIVNPVDLVKEILESLGPAMDRKHLQITQDLSFDLPFSGDPGALMTAFANMLENAVKYVPEGGKIRVEMRSEGKDLKLGISNSFEVIPKEVLANLFEPFYRGDTGTQRGSGLGLAIARKVVEAHGGGIQAMNAPDGFTVVIRLPHSPSQSRESGPRS